MVLKLSLEQKYWIFLGTSILSGLYIFEGTNSLVKGIVEFKLDFAPWVSVIHLLEIIIVWMFYRIFIVGRT